VVKEESFNHEFGLSEGIGGMALIRSSGRKNWRERNE
jgi:hypothetical protein